MACWADVKPLNRVCCYLETGFICHVGWRCAYPTYGFANLCGLVLISCRTPLRSSGLQRFKYTVGRKRARPMSGNGLAS